MLTHDDLRAYCMKQVAAVQEYPFGPGARVFKVMGKMFALIADESDPPSINLKCDPMLAQILRENYKAVQPGYHMDKRHWNTVICDGSIDDEEITDMIDASYDLVVSGLPRKDRDALRKETP
jgi:predicted DNA-binding protein (MmcQ/YjbR family)